MKKLCDSKHPKTGVKCCQPAGHTEKGPIKAHTGEDIKIPGGVFGAQGIKFVFWTEGK